MRKAISVLFLSLFMMSMSNNKLAVKEMDCVDEARAIAFYYMANHGYTEDEAAELVLLLIQGCDTSGSGITINP